MVEFSPRGAKIKIRCSCDFAAAPLFFIKDAGGGYGSPAVHSGNRHTRGSVAGIDPYIVGADSISARKPCGCGNVRG